jgi:predicted transglutaminase-like cysteine proteinase
MAFRKAWRVHVKKTYNWVMADSEAARYKDKEDASRAYLQELRKLNVHAISTKIRADGFHWKKEVVDFTSYPWVTIARKRGDCDDFMLLWEAALKYKGGRTKRVSVTSKEGGAHAMLLFYTGNTLYLLSNMYVRGTGQPGEEEKLIRLFYQDKTDCWMLY